MRATVEELQTAYEDYLSRHQIGSSRERRNVSARQAFMVAARSLYTTLEIKKATGKDHSTVIHSTKAHETNVRFDKLYVDFFTECASIVNKLKGSDYENEEWDLLVENAELRQQLADLRMELRQARNALKVNKYELCD